MPFRARGIIGPWVRREQRKNGKINNKRAQMIQSRPASVPISGVWDESGPTS